MFHIKRKVVRINKIENAHKWKNIYADQLTDTPHNEYAILQN